MKIGILAVQGDFEAHAAMLERLGVETVEVRTRTELEGCDGLILPGGESTTQLQFLQEEGLADAIAKFAEQGGAIFGTCAGAILLATEVQNPRQDSLKLLDMTVLQCVRPADRQRRGQRPDESQEGTAGNGFYSRPGY